MSSKLLEKEIENSPDLVSDDKINDEAFADNLTAIENNNSEKSVQSATDDNSNSENITDNDIIKKKTFTGNKRLIITLSVLSFFLIITAMATGVVIVNANPSYTEGTTENATELSTGKAVRATDEALTFKKSKYTVQVGKKIKVECSYTPHTNKYEQPQPYINYISNNIEIAKVDSNGNVTGVSTGTTSITALSDTGIYTTVPITVTAPKSHTIEDVPMLTQNYYYPSGCESVSSTMLLNYYGYKIETDDFIDKYLPTGYFTYDDKGNMIGPDTYSAFIGSPYSESALGCYPPVIEYAMNKYLKNKNHRAVDVTGASMDSLIYNYIANDQPVLIWATMYMWEPFVTYTWTVKDAASYSPYKDGDTCQWLANEHCMVLTGYDEYYYYLNDPLYYYDTVAYSREIFDQRYKEIGMCALVLQKTK